MKNIKIIRHLERVDSDGGTPEFERNWNMTDSKNELYSENPYLSDKNSSQKLLENLGQMKIDLIISSPFIRCVETSIIVAKSRGLNTINIDYGLGEFNDDLIYIDAYDTNKIYKSTQEHIKKKYPEINLVLLKNDYVGNKFETEDEYYERIKGVLQGVKEKNDNLLIVTHNYSLNWGLKKLLEYGIVYDIPNIENLAGAHEGGGNKYYDKYLKYKSKYLKLKKY